MKRGKDFLDTVSCAMALDSQPLPGVPLVEIYGQRRVLIENHLGVVGYSCTEILVKVRFGVICICGEALQLCKMCKEHLVVHGKISGVTLRGHD